MLGYDVDPGGGRLVVNEKESRRVREIFGLYKTHRSLLKVLAELDRLRATHTPAPGPFPSSEEMLREDRER